MKNIDYKKFKIVNYEIKYATAIETMENNQWGKWYESIDNVVNEHEVIRVALYDNDFVGVTYGNIEGSNSFLLDVICIEPKYQKKGFGTLMLDDFIQEVKAKFDIVSIKAELVYFNGIANSQKLLENKGFKKYKQPEKGYWGKLYPEVFCTGCNHCPCECTTLFYELIV